MKLSRMEEDLVLLDSTLHLFDLLSIADSDVSVLSGR